MPKKAKRRVSSEREASRSEILAAATRLFAEKGVDHVTFGEIARKAKLSRPLVYFYFPDLESVFLESLLLACDSLHKRFMATVRPGDSGLEQIRSIGRAYVAFSREDPASFALMAQNESPRMKEKGYEDLDRRCHEYSQAVMGIIIAAITKGIRDGSIRRDIGDPGKVAVSLWGLTHGLIQVASNKVDELEDNLGFSFTELPEFGLDLLSRSLESRR